MRTFKAVLLGFLTATLLIVAGEWGYTLLAGSATRGEYVSPLAAALLAVLFTGASVVVGAYVATRIHDAAETISGFSIVQAFFGFGVIREFWSEGSSWYAVGAVVLVIPCAFIGRALARRFGRDKVVLAA